MTTVRAIESPGAAPREIVVAGPAVAPQVAGSSYVHPEVHTGRELVAGNVHGS